MGRIGSDGSIWNNQNSAKRCIKITREIEKKFNLKPTIAKKRKRKSITSNEKGIAQRLNETLPKQIIADKIDSAIKQSNGNMKTFITKLENDNVNVRLTVTKDNKLRGISFSFKNYSGELSPNVKGSEIGRGYSIAGIKNRLSEHKQRVSTARNTQHKENSIKAKTPNFLIPKPVDNFTNLKTEIKVKPKPSPLSPLGNDTIAKSRDEEFERIMREKKEEREALE